MNKYFISLILLISSSVYAGVCCNPGGNEVPSMVLCSGSPNVTGSPCCNPSTNQPGGSSQQPITWNIGSSCNDNANQNCCINKVPQGQPEDCQALGANLLAMAANGGYVDIVGRCNQIWGGGSCEWKCDGNTGTGTGPVKPVKPVRPVVKPRKK